MTDIACRCFLVSGRVQGVFFRASAARTAGRLGLSGSATNLADGRVEVMARGERCKVDEFARWLATGPVTATVAGVEMRDVNPVDWADDDGFSVR